MAKPNMSPEQLAAILGPNADAAFMKMMLQEDAGPSNSGLVAPTNVGAGLHNIGVYINGAAQFNARKAERKEMMGMFGQAADINNKTASAGFNGFMGGGGAAPAAPPMAQAPTAPPPPTPSAPAFARAPSPSPVSSPGPAGRPAYDGSTPGTVMSRTPMPGSPPMGAPAMAAPPAAAPPPSAAPQQSSAPAFARPPAEPGAIPPPIGTPQPQSPGPRSNRMTPDQYNAHVANVQGQSWYRLLKPDQKQIVDARLAAQAPAKSEYKTSGDDIVELTNGEAKVVHRGDKSTNDMRNYKAYYDQEVAAGRVPKTAEKFWLDEKRAGVQQPENKFASEAASAQVKRLTGLVDAGDTARGFRQQMDILREHSGAIGTQGALATFKQAFGPVANALGIQLDGLDDIQAFTSIIQKMAPTMRAPGSGATSDLEFKGFLAALPNLAGTAEGRTMIIDQLSAIAQDAETRAELAARVLDGEIDRKEADKMLRGLPDMMSHYRAYQKASKERAAGGGVAPAAPAAAPKIAPGTVMQGYRFKGGDPASQASWEKVQ